MRNFMLAIPCFLSLFSCATRDTEKDYSAAVTVDEDTEYTAELVINEFSPKSKALNEFGEEADWIELYNPSEVPLEIKGASWSLSDDESDPLKYILPDTLIPAGGHLLIWCDNRLSEEGFLHAGFKLAGNGEVLYLFKNETLVDEISYDDDIKKACSYGRSEDGSADWEKFKQPTPGTSNVLLEHYAETLK